MEDKKNIFEKSVELIGGVQIFLSPFLIGAALSAIVYFPNPNTITLIIAILLFLLGIIIGITLAFKSYKSKEGTIGFISKTDSTPEIDKLLNKEKNDNR
ncbi:hypothetical protein SAMN05443633_11489 [Chryseobacterium arachidis]|uniref:Uncharacterized protein n=1 Tax=Chryseobacterium arachidis TaxID=1416778 RepID=A0A1M5JFL7_9FLAO|nr:hypothetical protein [Chryseobacterium arachidis]SHG38833.1 hypothetical protein SAMN05443633_11489 [Chryseobacterium arachidis]